ncbi:MAG: hypothetical protein WAM53_16130 [Terrimicrobiaceae bacterium]
MSLAFLGTSFRRRSVALAKAGKLVSLRNGVKRRNLLDSNQAVRALPAAAGQPPHPFAAQHDDSHSSGVLGSSRSREGEQDGILPWMLAKGIPACN